MESVAKAESARKFDLEPDHLWFRANPNRNIRVRKAFACEVLATGAGRAGRAAYTICKQIRPGNRYYHCFDVPRGWLAPVTGPGAARLWERLGGDDAFKMMEVA